MGPWVPCASKPEFFPLSAVFAAFLEFSLFPTYPLEAQTQHQKLFGGPLGSLWEAKEAESGAKMLCKGMSKGIKMPLQRNMQTMVIKARRSIG